jgi:hypothetical protein
MQRLHFLLFFIASFIFSFNNANSTTCVGLPIRWLNFTADISEQSGVHLVWTVVEDNTVKKYHVERSTDAVQWIRLASIKRTGPLDLPSIEYDYTDIDYLPGKTFYRIVSEDVYGKTRTSEVRQVIAADQDFSISPNPAKNKLTIKQQNARTSLVDIYDNYGKLILTCKLVYPNETIDISKLAKGNYFLRVSVDGIETASGSFIKI